MFDFITSIDFTILDFIHNNLSCGFLDFLMPMITTLGNSGIIWILIAAIMLSIKKYRKNGIILIAALACGVIIGNLILKNLIARDRPCWINADVLMLIPIPTDYSFPSGHTLSSFAAQQFCFMPIKNSELQL